MIFIKNWSTPLTISAVARGAPMPDTSRFNIADLLDFFQSLGNACKLLLSEICTLGKLMLVMAATNAISEHSFSALK